MKTTTQKPDGKPALTPKLRFPEFRDAEGWEEKRFNEVLIQVPEVTRVEQRVLFGFENAEHFPNGNVFQGQVGTALPKILGFFADTWDQYFSTFAEP
jgi:hypothetical protein